MSPKKKFVLIADDDATIVRFISAVVEKEGLETAAALDGKAAYKALRSQKNIVCAIIDVRMPYIEGTELVKFMQTDEELSRIPVILMTGEHQAKYSDVGRSAGAVAFLPKPFTNHQVRLMLHTLLRKDQLQDS